MENTTDITANIINTINTIMGNLFSSVDNSLYEVLDNLIFVNEDILNSNLSKEIVEGFKNNKLVHSLCQRCGFRESKRR